jgi:hypothetical protein
MDSTPLPSGRIICPRSDPREPSRNYSGCLIAYACGLSFEKGKNEDKGILTFKAMGKEQTSSFKLEEYYRERYGALMNRLGFMEIHPDGSRSLMEEYLFKKGS